MCSEFELNVADVCDWYDDRGVECGDDIDGKLESDAGCAVTNDGDGICGVCEFGVDLDCDGMFLSYIFCGSSKLACILIRYLLMASMLISHGDHFRMILGFPFGFTPL